MISNYSRDIKRKKIEVTYFDVIIDFAAFGT